MKATIIATLLFASLLAQVSASGGFKWIFEGSRYAGLEKLRFEVPMGEKDQWDSSAQESPPLLPGKAIRLAKEFMQRFPPPPGTRWQVEQVKLLRYAGSEDEEHEQWLYVVVFNYKIPGRGRQMPRSDIEVPVRMDGTIPEPESSNEPSSPQQAPKAP